MSAFLCCPPVHSFYQVADGPQKVTHRIGDKHEDTEPAKVNAIFSKNVPQLRHVKHRYKEEYRSWYDDANLLVKR